METFDFPYHAFRTKNPESSVRVQFGRSWQFTAAPSAPDERIFVLNFEAMKYFVDSQGEIDTSTQPQVNMGLLEEFYDTHKMWKRFTYPHPRFGNVVVRFNKPLETPKVRPTGTGITEGFEVELIEQP